MGVQPRLRVTEAFLTSPVSLALILTFTVTTAASHALLKRGLAGAHIPGDGIDVARIASHCLQSPHFWLALSMQAVGYALWVVVISRERLAVATAISGSFFYLFMAVLGWIFFKERLSFPQLTGLILIASGVMLMSKS